MPEQARTRDCVVLVKGDTVPVVVSDSMAIAGWQGGQGVSYVGSVKDEFIVTLSTGSISGFMLWGSDESSDQFTSMTRNQPYYRFATLCAGGWHILTRSFERYTYASRLAGGPLVPVSYQPSDRLLFSLRGFWTKEDEWSLSGDPRAPNSLVAGYVSQVPSSLTEFYLGVQVAI
jgi:hypothetical protein